MDTLCKVAGCDGKATRKSMCQKHYRRNKVHGDPSITNRRSHADGKGYRNAGEKGEHVVVAERALGKPLPPEVVVHHVNEDRSNNAPSNLVICPSTKYHALLHIRMRALAATGNANARKCKICHEYGTPGEVTILSNGAVYHPHCNRAHVAKYAMRRQEAACQ